MECLRRIARGLFIVAAACCLAFDAPGEAAAQAADAAAGPRVFVCVLNSVGMRQNDSQHRVADAYLTMLALLPDGAGCALITARSDVSQPLAWVNRADAAAFGTFLHASADSLQKWASTKLLYQQFITDALKALTAKPNGQPLTAVFINAVRTGVDASVWQDAVRALAGSDTVFRLPGYADSFQLSEKGALDISQALTGEALSPSAATGAGSAVYGLTRNTGSGFADAAFADVRRLLTGRFGLATLDAAVTADGDAWVVSTDGLPAHGIRDVWLLLRDVPADRVAVTGGAAGAYGAAETLAPVISLRGSANGLENRVYTLPVLADGSFAPIRLIQPKEDATASPSGQAPQAAAVLPSGEATQPAAALPSGQAPQAAVQPAEMPLAATVAAAVPQTLTAQIFYRVAVPPATQPYLLDEAPQKNKPFRVGVAFQDVGEQVAYMQGGSAREAFLRVESDAGEAFTCPVVYDDKGNLLTAEVTFPRSGTYRLLSGVRNTAGAPLETLTEQPLTVQIGNAPPVPVEKEMTIDLFTDKPFAIPAAPESVVLSLHDCFTDADNANDTLTYWVLPESPESAADIGVSAYYLSKQGRYNATIDERSGDMTLCGLTDALEKPLWEDQFSVVARDDEQVLGTMRVTLRLHSVRALLASLALTNLTHARENAIGDSPPRESVQVSLPFDTLPDELKHFLQKNLKVTARCLPADSPEETGTGAAALLVADAQGDTWHGLLDRPNESGTYALEVTARLNDAAGGAPYSSEGWTLREREPGIRVINPTPKLLKAPQTREMLLDALDGMYAPRPFTLELESLFQKPDDSALLTYRLRVTDETGAPCKAVLLQNAAGNQSWLLIGCTDAYVNTVKTNNKATEAEPLKAAEGIKTPVYNVSGSISVEVGRTGETVIELSAVNRDSAPAVYRDTVRAEDKLVRALTLGAIGLGAVTFIALLALWIAHLRIRPYADDLRLTLRDPSVGERSVRLSLPRWKRRKVRLSMLLLGGAMPCLPWLDALEKQVWIRATRHGPVLVLHRKALSHVSLTGNADHTARRAALTQDSETRLTVRGGFTEQLIFQLTPPREVSRARRRHGKPPKHMGQ